MRSTAMISKCAGMLWSRERSNRAGTSFRQVKSPAPPKMTNTVGSSWSFISCFSRQAALIGCLPSFHLSQPDHHFANVLPPKKAQERAHRLVDSVHDGFLVLQLAGLEIAS